MMKSEESHQKGAPSALTKIRGIFSAFQAIHDTMPIQIASTFLTVAQYEGRSLKEYCDLAGVAQSTMSRHLLDLGERNRQKQPGFMLVEQKPDPQDLRRNVYRLTPRGRKLVDTIAAVMEQ